MPSLVINWVFNSSSQLALLPEPLMPMSMLEDKAMTVKAEKRPWFFQAHSASSKPHDDFLTLVLPKKTALTSLFHSPGIFSLKLGFIVCFLIQIHFC